MTKQKNKFLRRYTNLPSLFDILQNKRLTLLDPSTWDDKNDSHFIEQYKEKTNLKTVTCLCFTGKGETYHHWKVFSDGPSGICIVFKKDLLLEHIKDIPGIKFDTVKYKKIKELESNPPQKNDMPFLKRIPYRDEKEFRIIYENNNGTETHKHIDIELAHIEKITLSPWTPEPLIVSVRQAIKNIYSISVVRTTLLNNDKWKQIGSSLK